MIGVADTALHDRVRVALARNVVPPIRAFAEKLARDAGARAALFYGSNLRSESLDGVLDFYILTPGEPERGLWPRVSYHEYTAPDGSELRAKVATMTLAMFTVAASGELVDTTIWARFVQPSGLAWVADDAAAGQVVAAVSQAAVTAARFATALGPPAGTPDDYWRALFQATYRAEFRIEKPGRENDILGVNREHFAGLLPLALAAGGIAFARDGDVITPRLSAETRASLRRRWGLRRRLGKFYGVARLVRASTTFEGAARYAAWKVERHTGVPVVVTPWVERHPVLAAPGVLWRVWRARRVQSGKTA